MLSFFYQKNSAWNTKNNIVNLKIDIVNKYNSQIFSILKLSSFADSIVYFFIINTLSLLVQ